MKLFRSPPFFLSFTLCVLAAASAPAVSAYAAGINYSADVPVSLPGAALPTTVTILSGSAANGVVINSGSIVVTTDPASAFTISSPVNFLVVSGVIGASNEVRCYLGGGGTVTVPAQAGSQTLTFTVTNSRCGGRNLIWPPADTGSGSGSSGVGTSATTTATATATSTPKTPENLNPDTSAGDKDARIKALQALLKSLTDQLAALTGARSAGGWSAIFRFTRDLRVGSIGDDVKELQIYLNNHGFLLTKSGPGSPGHETTKFGGATRNALQAFQKNAGISPASGMLGPVTRAKLNAAF